MKEWVKKQHFKRVTAIVSTALIIATILAILLPTRITISPNGKWISIGLSGVYATEASYSPSANTNGSLPWTNPDRAYGSNNSYATVAPTYGATTSKQPTANAAGTYTQWTNPANAYDGGSNQYATATVAATSQTKYPTSDVQDTASSSKSTGSTFYGLVDETPASDSDYFTMTTNAGGHNIMNNTAWSIPSGAVIQNLTIYYRAGNSASNAANIRASILTGTTYRDTTDSGYDPSDSPTYTNYSYAFTVNPATGSAWTYDEINATDATTEHRLNGFGVASSDCNPDVNVSQVYAVCNYIPGDQYDQVYTTHAITDPGTTSTISKVEIGYEAYCDTASKTVNFYSSANGGSTWSSVHTSAAWATSDPGTYTYIDITADQTWTWTLLNNTNFKVKIETPVPTAACVRYLDNLIVRVTYDDRRAYDQIWGTYGISIADCTVTKVEVGYEAYATATGRFKIYTSNDTGSTWSSAHTTSNLGTTDPDATTWIDCTADYAWTPTYLNNTNFKVKVVTDYVSGTPAFSLDYLPVRVTYTEPVSITNSPASYDFSSVLVGIDETTGLDYFTLTNTGSGIINITIHGHDMTGGVGWTLSDTATAGENIVGFKAGTALAQQIVGFASGDERLTVGVASGDERLTSGMAGQGDYTVIVKKNTTYNTLIYKLGAGVINKFGIKIIVPSSFTDGVQKTGTITLTGVSS